LDYE